MEPQKFDSDMADLVDAWCERRQLKLLSIILRVYPRVSGLTDEWAEIASALKTIRSQHLNQLEVDELNKVTDLQQYAESLLHE
jgi:hypothetical protein